MAFTYQPRAEANWNKRANQSGSNYANVIQDQFNTFGAKDGENQIRILPPTWEDPEHYGYDIWVHFNVGPEGGTVLCLSRMKHQACPICEAQAKYEAGGREDAADFKPKRRVAVWLVDKKAEKPEDNPCIWTMGWTVDRDITKSCKDRESGKLFMIDHPTAGYDAFFDKTGKGDTTKYIGFAISRNPSSIDQKYIDFIVQNPIPSCLIWRDYKEVQDLFEGEAPPKTEESVVATSGVTSGVPQTQAPVPAQAPVTVALAPPPPAPPKPFVSDWVLVNNEVVPCPTCSKPLYTISPEEATCEAAHRIALATLFAPPAPPPAQIPAEAPPRTSPGNGAPTQISQRADAVKARFQTGQPK
jgi:hypothetical protein